MLTAEQAEFFEFFAIAAPPGITAEGADRFMRAYLRDEARRSRWEQRQQGRAEAPVAAIAGAAAAPPLTPSRPGRAMPPSVPARVAPTLGSAAPRSPTAVGGAAAPVPVQASNLEPQALAFTGSGSEYAGIWIVNMLLTIATLGFYGAWAKVRRLQYFYRHTQLAGATFDYHGNGWAILKGRFIAFGLLMAYNLSFKTSATLGFATLALLGVSLPWLLRNSFRFRLRNSSYRGVRFRFSGTTEGAYAQFLLRPIAVLTTVYLMAPWFHQRLKRYQHGNASFGGTPFSFHAGVGAFYREYLLVGLVSLLALAVPAFLFGGVFSQLMHSMAQGGGAASQAAVGLAIAMFVALIGGSLLVTPLWQARIQNLVWSGTKLGPHAFASSASGGRLFLIYLTNALGILLTAGLFTPWAAVRLARYRATTLALVPAESLDTFVAAQGEEVDATGDEAAELFDIDIAL